MDVSNSRKQGYEYQREQTRRILEASRGMKSISHEDSKGRPILAVTDICEGPDAGIDLRTRIGAKSQQALSRVRNRFEAKLRDQDA